MRIVRYRVRGGAQLTGTAVVQGAKNAVLPMIAAALMASEGRTVLRNVPLIDDVHDAIALARAVGAEVELHEADRVLVIDATTLTSSLLPGELTRRFRGSVLFIPAVLHRLGEVTYEGVGGCNLGTRALDWHYRGLARLGASVEEHAGQLHAKAANLRGARLYLDTPSHTGTENLLMAAAVSDGTTVIENAALEPEILDVVALLSLMGARVSGAGTGRLVVDGADGLHGVDYTVMPDRVDAGVLAIAAAITGGHVALVAGDALEHLGVARFKLEQMGVELASSGGIMHARRRGTLHPINIITDTHPGFATDLQPSLMTLATQAEGTSYIHERVHDARYALVTELTKLGARIEVDGDKAVIHGPARLRGAEVIAHDLRTGVSLVLAGLVADGETVITQGATIDRGHADLARRFTALGAHISREINDI